MTYEEFQKATIAQRIRYNLSILTRAYSNADDLTNLQICEKISWNDYEPGNTINMHEHMLRIKPRFNIKLATEKTGKTAEKLDSLLGKVIINKSGLTSHIVVYEDSEGIMIIGGNGGIRIQRSDLLNYYHVQEISND